MAQSNPVTVTKTPKKHTSELARSEERTALWLLLPTFAMLFLLAIYPLGQVFYLSFTNARFADPNATTAFVGWSNYRDLLSFTVRELPRELDDAGQPVVEDGVPQYENAFRILPREPRRYSSLWEFNLGSNRYVLGAASAEFIRAVWDTVVVAVIAVALEAILGMAIALVLATKFLGRGVMRAAMLVPWAIITVVSTRIWEWMLASDRKGFFNALFNRMGLSDGFVDWTGNPTYQVPCHYRYGGLENHALYGAPIVGRSLYNSQRSLRSCRDRRCDQGAAVLFDDAAAADPDARGRARFPHARFAPHLRRISDYVR